MSVIMEQAMKQVSALTWRDIGLRYHPNWYVL